MMIRGHADTTRRYPGKQWGRKFPSGSPRGWGERFGPLARARRDRSGAIAARITAGDRGAGRGTRRMLSFGDPHPYYPTIRSGRGRETQQIKIRTLRVPHPPRSPFRPAARRTRARSASVGRIARPSHGTTAATVCEGERSPVGAKRSYNARPTTRRTDPERFHCPMIRARVRATSGAPASSQTPPMVSRQPR